MTNCIITFYIISKYIESYIKITIIIVKILYKSGMSLKFLEIVSHFYYIFHIHQFGANIYNIIFSISC